MYTFRLPNIRTKKKNQKRQINIKKLFKEQNKRYQEAYEYFQSLKPEYRIEFLKDIANSFKRNMHKYEDSRSAKIYMQNDYCEVCGKPAYCVHHIRPICNGGNNNKYNLISICKSCHKEIHPWLKS